MIYTKQKLDDKIIENFSQHKEYMDFFNSLLTFSKLTNDYNTELTYKELYQYNRFTAEFNDNEVSLLINKNNNDIDLEFIFDYENSKLKSYNKSRFLDYLELKYLFKINKDFFESVCKIRGRHLYCYIRFYEKPTNQQLFNFISDLIINKIDDGGIKDVQYSNEI